MSTLIVCGRVGSDAELRSLQNDTQVLQFSVADQVGYGDKKSTQWIKCALFGKRAATLQQYILKGTTVEVIGSPVVEAWSDKTSGSAKAAIKLTVSEVKLHGGKPDDAPKRGNTQQPKEDDIPW